TAKQLQEASREGTILPLDVSYKVAETLETEMNSEIQLAAYKFIHDRIQQAANTLLSEEERVSNHVKIGKALLGGIDSESLQEKIFEIVNHLNYGLDTLESTEEKSQLLDLNYKAGMRALESFSYESAVKYFEKGIILISPNSSRELKFKFYYEYFSSIYKTGQPQHVYSQIDSLFLYSTTKIENALIYNLKVLCQTNLGEYENSVRTCIQALKLFDIDLKENITGKDIFNYYKTLSRKLAMMTTQDLLNLPIMENLEIKIVMDILMNTATAAYWKLPNYGTLYCLIMVNFSLDYGNSYASSFGYSIYGGFLTAIGDFKKALDFGNLSLTLTKKLTHDSTVLKVPLVNGVAIFNWNLHSKYSVDLMMNAFKEFSLTKDIL
ncbi:MAG: hypothetical protein EBS19_15530, partial [Spirochaetia bacterium]|nr:hypothetical protein [Spirochaetia bacterium]